MMKRNDSGMSFIEMTVVVIIVGILATVSIMGVGTINHPKAMECAKLISAGLDKSRLEAMSRMDKEMTALIFSEDGKRFLTIAEAGEFPSKDDGRAVTLGDDNLEISVNGEKLGDDVLEIKFDKGSGAFTDNGIFKEGSCELLVEGSKEAKVILVQRTGRNYIE